MNSNGDIRQLQDGDKPTPGDIPLTYAQAKRFMDMSLGDRRTWYAGRSTKNGADAKRLKRVGRLR